MRPAVAYYRVSTDKQGRGGLGIDAQREAVHRFVAAERMEPWPQGGLQPAQM